MEQTSKLMSFPLCCLLVFSVLRKANAQNWVSAQKNKHKEQGLATVLGMEFTPSPLLNSKDFDFHTKDHISQTYKQDPFNRYYLEPQNLLSKPVTVTCSAYKLRVEVRKDFWGPRAPQLSSADLSLGRACKSNQETADIIVFSYDLHTCGNWRTVTDKELIYSNFLLYTPSTGMLPQQRNLTTVHCHYERERMISSHGVKPTWSPNWMQRSIAGFLDFFLDVMTEDWQSKSNTNVFYLGQTINLQVSINLHQHTGLKVYVDGCMASTKGIYQGSGLGHSYSIIQDYGCLTDSRVAHSMAKFLSPRTDSSLRFQIKAFRFKGHKDNLMFIHCTVKVSDNKAPPGDQSKSCQYNAETESWEELEGRGSLCDCCETWSCGRRRRPRNISPLQYRSHIASIREVMVGPLHILLPLSKDDIQAWPPTSKLPWDTLRHHLGGMWGMPVGQLVTMCVSALCTLFVLAGLLQLFLRCHPFPAPKPPSPLPTEADATL